MEKDIILFDLDGTLTDPKTGITKSVQYSLKALGIIVENCNNLVTFIGPPLRDSYKKYYNMSDSDTEEAVSKYREYFSKEGIFENELYEGIDELLKGLNHNGKKIILATSKPTVYAKQILEYFKIDKYFSFIAGSELNGERSQKDLVISYALSKQNITALDKVVMVGDREYDIIGSKKFGIDSIGVLYGYGDANELANAGATFIVQSVDELHKLLIQNND